MAVIQFLNTTHFDFGALSNLSAALTELGVKRPLICTDKGLVALGMVDTVRGVLSNEITPTIYDGTPENPTEEAVLEAVKLYKEADCDGVVMLGGGSSLDLGKAVALMATHDGSLAGFSVVEGGVEKIGQVAPIVAIPTTAGTGSEVSVGSVIISSDGRKLILASRSLLPDVAICDPELTMGLPPLLTAATGMDAVTHCIEAVLSPADNPPAEAIGLDGLERAIARGWLERAVADGSDREARRNMMIAAMEGAMAFQKGLGAVHSMSHACGRIKELRLHHGTLNAVILPTVLRFNAGHVGDKYDRLCKAMELPKGTDLAEMIEGLNKRLNLPANLGEMGITTETPGLVENALSDVCTFTNPRIPTAEEYEKLFEEAIAA